jgi:hypothetical protein
MIRLLRPTVAASLAIFAFACSPKGSAPPSCGSTGASVCTPAGAAAYCADLTSDVANCGTCGNKCAAPTGGTVACAAGLCKSNCTGTGAPAACNGKCTDTNADHDNCGACGKTCGAQQQCVAAVCTSTNTTQCTPGGAPVNLATDPANCGACGNACATGQTCNSGVCTTGSCGTGTTICPGTPAFCSNLTSDANNCGNCGNKCPTPTGNAGPSTCAAGACVVNCGGPNKIACNNKCTDKTTDHDNCGGCGIVCGGQQICLTGACTSNAVTHTQCAPGAPAVDLTSDVNNCGSCGNKCAAGQTCYQGLCSVGSGPTTCVGATSSTTQCPARTGAPVPYCTNTNTDTTNCGICGNVCSGPGVVQCNSGVCQNDCGSGPNTPPMLACNNACVNTLTNHENCGTCGTACGGQQVCTGGVCQAQGTTICAGGGTPVNLQTDRANCGACGNACTASEVCKNGRCDPCPIAQCGNFCIDTLHDPANCGACGAAVPAGQYCENGKALAKIAIELVPPLSGSAPVVAAAGMSFSVNVHSGLRVSRVTVKTAATVPGLATATATDMTLSPPAEASPTVWSGTLAAGTAGATIAIQIDAYDEQYLPSLGTGAPANASHFDSKQVTATYIAAPTATMTLTAAVGANAVGGGTSCQGSVACKWVPLNAGPITLTASAVVPGAGINVAQIEFRAVTTGTTVTDAKTVLCPSRVPAAAPPVAVPCAQNVTAGQATLTLNTADVGEGPVQTTATTGAGDVTIYGCPLDAAGQRGACTAGPSFTIGRVAACPTTAPCAMPSQPVIGTNADTRGTPQVTRTIYYLAFTDPGPNTLPGLFAQDYLLLNSNAVDQPGALVGSSRYLADSLTATADGSGVFAIRCTTCTATLVGNTLIDRVDCPNTANTTACFRQGFVTGGTFRTIHVATPVAALISDSTAASGGNAFYADVQQTGQTTPTALAVGVLQVTTVNGAASGGTNWATTAKGAIVAWFNNTGAIAPVVFHPNLPGSHSVALPVQAGTLTNPELVVFPSGEIVYQYSVGGGVFLGVAYYDGSSTPPKTIPPFQIGPGTSTVLGKNFMTAGTGVLLGEVPSALNNTKFQALEINFNTFNATAAAPKVPIAFDGTITGAFHESGVLGRTNVAGTASNFAVSDDKTKAIFITDDPPVAGTTATIWRLHLVNLGDATQVSLAGSERMLCALTATTSTTTNPGDCAPNVAGSPHYPRFVHSAGPFVGAASSGLNQVVVWEEESRFPAASAQTRRARLWFASFSGAGSPVAASIDRLNSYGASAAGGPIPATVVESAAAGAIFFLSDNDLGGADLFTVPLTPPSANPVVSAKVIDRVYAFKVREETTPPRLLVSRADGTLYNAPLASGGANPAGALTPIAQSGLQGDVPYGQLPAAFAFGFTPDGNHAFLVSDQQFYYSSTVGYWGILQTIDLTAAPFARTNWGRVAYTYLPPVTAGFIANATAAEIVDLVSIEGFGQGRLNVALSSNPTSHADTKQFAGDPTATANFAFTPSLDGSEGMVSYAGAANAFGKDGKFLPLAAGVESLQQAATNSPFGGPYRPEYSQVNGGFFSGGSSSIFKVWGTTTPATSPPPFITVSRGIRAASTTQTRQTSDNKELLYSFKDSVGADVNGAYAIWFQLSGRKAPDPLLP